ncbi:MAG: dinitrogenase iron-molybdenum cofactor biosynthesis protein [Candidatus Syntrophoarchaeum caldarius]|uniref:Dinitrogenase iron-molybdenum cofactor biosynthesis protein n=1 Tax=Candidatus Syntropharchaeum caldarium TaxID=1838285 RepID=A0A1F2PA15_9EURY|nr:MAG: dinitrogenase iron-molybdenum cofactor biosynthesis protein [Candidatus Syntrophoarchaeum caldarius]
MKICVTSTGSDLDAQVDPRFGRCQYFMIIDPDTMEFEAIPNEGIGASSGAGIQAAQTVANRGVDVLISGNVGPNAFQTLTAAGVRVLTGASGTIRDAIEMYRAGKLSETAGATVPGHAGMPPSTPETFAGGGAGMGMGGRRGMGRGGGGGGRGMGMPEQVPPQPSTNIDALLERVDKLEKELEEVKRKVGR